MFLFSDERGRGKRERRKREGQKQPFNLIDGGFLQMVVSIK